MKNLKSYAELIPGLSAGRKSFLLLYKSGSDQSTCARQNFESSLGSLNDVNLYLADVNEVKDIHGRYGITTVPSLLIFENDNLVSVVKGCQSGNFYKALVGNNLYKAQQGAEKEPKPKMLRHFWGCRTTISKRFKNWNTLGRVAVEGESPVQVIKSLVVVS